MIEVSAVEYLIKQYALQQGALEIQYIEEFFLDFPRKKTAAEVIRRLSDRDHQILMAEAPLPDERRTVDVRRTGEVLVIRVTDNGVGGADPGTGTGLASLARRARSVDGSLEIDSPAGGPTVITVELPCAS